MIDARMRRECKEKEKETGELDRVVEGKEGRERVTYESTRS